MPRISFHQFYDRHRSLKRLWLECNDTFSYVTFAQQRVLHDYYQPTRFLTPEELHEHWTEISKTQPSLPNRAGKSYHQLRRQLQAPSRPRPHVSKTTTQKSGKRRTIHRRAVARPEVDEEKLVQALMMLYYEEQKVERKAA